MEDKMEESNINEAPSTAEGSGLAEGSAVPAADGTAPMEDAANGSEGPAAEGTTEPPTVDAKLLEELTEMGFPQNRATRGLFYGGSTVDSAVNWMIEHENDPDINDPLPPDAVAPEKRVLTEEEKRQKADELKQRIAENRRIQAEQEKKTEKDREKERIIRGKELAESRKRLEEQERVRQLDLRRREKEEDARERERLRQLLRDDRIRRYGVDKANEMEEKDRQKAEEVAKRRAEEKLAKEKQAELQTSSTSAHSLGAAQVDQAVQGMKAAVQAIEENPAAVRKTCLETLLAYVSNVVNNPSEPKYRKIRLENAAFQKRVQAAKGGVDFLAAVGFTKDPETAFLVLSHSDMILLNRARGDLELLLTTRAT